MYLAVVQPLPGWWAIGALVGLVAVGVDLVVSGVRGYCPVYRHVALPWARRQRPRPNPADGNRPTATADPGTGAPPLGSRSRP
ncbi:MAG: YgaP family membrane protein [Acidimicrobiales bacterium]